MVSNMCTLQRLQRCLQRFETNFLRWMGIQGYQGPLDRIAFDLNVVANPSTNTGKENSQSVLDLLKDNILYAVPKNRRTREKRLTRKFGKTYIEKWATPRKDIISCLECGQYHEQGVICGNCYKKVRDETKSMMEAMGDKLKYDVPRNEVVYLYKEEKDNREKYEGKYIVEMDKPKPKWFSDALLKKVTSKP